MKKAAKVEAKAFLPSTARPTAAPKHLLLGDEHLEEAIRIGLLELVGVRRVGHLAVEDDHRPADAAPRATRASP